MLIEIDKPLVEAYFAAGGKNTPLRQALKARRWGNFDVDTDILTEGDLELLVKCSKANPEFTDSRDKRRNIRSLKSLLELRSDKGKPISKLEPMVEAIRMLLMPLAHHWVFRDVDGWMVPFYVEKIKFNPRETRSGYETPAYVNIDLRAWARGKNVKDSENFRREALGKGCSPQALLEKIGMFPETEELVKQYETDMDRYNRFAGMAGEQFLATGEGTVGPADFKDNAESYDRRWRLDRIKLTSQGEPGRVVMDDRVGFGDDDDDDDDRRRGKMGCSSALWLKARRNDDREEAEDEGEVVIPPTHPFVNAFSMVTHEFVVTHTNNLELYEYNPKLADKLVLPQAHRDLVDALLGAAGGVTQDIIRGKAGGTIILCSGVPGTGKTLTAEVYSEIARRPLYTVQCSQLGINPQDLEGELGRVLNRAARWRAVLLIDEADVYIHDRGTDVRQNAIVGVFLRMLEYYSGVLFLTTNRETVVDDAVSSRCIAHIHYDVPKTPEAREKIWGILSLQFKLPLSASMVIALAKEYPNISGRTVKQLCRLASAMSKTRKVDMELFGWLAQYQRLEGLG